MTNKDQEVFKGSLATLLSLKQNLPTDRYIHERYVHEYHEVLNGLASTGLDIERYRIDGGQLERFMTSFNGLTGETHYASYREIERSFLLLKVDALLNHFSIGDQNVEMGFRTE